MVDRLTLDDEGAAHEEFSLADFPEEELLRLDDGTPLPAALTELRSLLNLHAAAAAEPVVQSDDDPEAAARLAAIAASKADMLRDCLLDFDEGLLLLHDKLLDHESLVKRLNAVRKRKTAIPAGRFAYDEAVSFDDEDGDENSGGANGQPAPTASSSAEPRSAAISAAAADDSDDDLLDLSDFLRATGPGGAGPRKEDGGGAGDGGGGGTKKKKTEEEEGGNGGGGGHRVTVLLEGAERGAAATAREAAAAIAQETPDDTQDAAMAQADELEDEETLDQKVMESRRQIKSWLRALEEGSANRCPLHTRSLALAFMRTAARVAAAARPRMALLEAVSAGAA